MSTDDSLRDDAGAVFDLYRTDEKYEFRLTGILRKRRRPLLLMIDERGQLLYSSLSDDASASEVRLRDHVLSETRSLSYSDFRVGDVVRHVVVDKPGQRSALFMLDDTFYSLTLFPMHASAGQRVTDHYAALVEPIGLLAEGINYQKVKEAFRLSNRELDVLQSLMSGKKDKQIARALGISVGTIRAYLKSVRAKLRVTTRTAIVTRVHELSDDPQGAD